MRESEWLKYGYDMGVVEPDILSEEPFCRVYNSWFLYKYGVVQMNTLDRYENTYNRYYKYSDFVNMPISLIDEKVIIEFLNKCIIDSGSMTLKEYKRLKGIVLGVMKYARDMEYLGVNMIDWEKVDHYVMKNRLSKKNKPDMPIPLKDVNALFKGVLVDNVYPQKYSTCLCILLNFYLGLRAGELAALTWQDVDLKRRLIHVNKTWYRCFARTEEMERLGLCSYYIEDGTKTDAGVRDVPLCDEALYILQLLKKWHVKSGYEEKLLVYDGKECNFYLGVGTTLRVLCRRCGCSAIYAPHKIRKTYVSYLHEKGVPTKVISDLCGHTMVSTTERYYVRGMRDLDGVRKILAEPFHFMVDMHK